MIENREATVLATRRWETGECRFTLRVEKNSLGFSALLFAEKQTRLLPPCFSLPIVGVGKTPAAALGSLMRVKAPEVTEHREVLRSLRDEVSPVRLAA